jgi:4-hydroxy-tetrahydrodipicolinate synthase
MFRGAFTALVTPFRDGRVDDDALSRLVEEQIEAGIDGLVPCGTTGESPALSHAEHVHVVEVVLRAARGRVPVLAGAGSNSTREAIEVGRACKELGAAGQLQITPYYNKPSQDGLIAHFQAIAEAAALPMILYNVPGRTGVDMLPESVARLASEQPLVRGIKEATGDMHRAARIRELCGDDFSLLSGDDFSLLPFLAVGGDGVISVVSNCMPDVMAGLCKAAREDRWAEAKKLHYKQLPLSRALFSRSNPMPVKTAMAVLGKIAPEIRLPLQILPEGSPEHATLTRELKSAGLLP